MTDLRNILYREIEATGPISVSDFMTQCLCHPKYGYYMTRDPFGAKGDFTTAPEISQCFGELLGLWAAITWQQMGSPKAFHLVELGPGRGTLMSDALRAVKMVPGFLEAAQVHLVEISPTLKEKQKETLSDFDIIWHDSVTDIPDGPAIFIANEFFDALPIRQFEKGEKGWAERFIDIDPDNDSLRFVLQSDQAATALMPAPLEDKESVGDRFEISIVSQSIAHMLADRIQNQSGAVLALDYGYAKPAFGETLQALKDHKYIDVLETPGEADLTAHVDFNTLGKSFTEGGAKVWGPMGQGEFLEQLGITQRMQALLENAKDDQKDDIVAAHKRLCSPEEMGSLFKVICATHPNHPAPPAFEGS
ncbi:SAM-dependent methyltransferase [Terasakiella sp. A23]|uniref:class I SAM-dependent methyltransferase n=1 Tax=Terasakiella sp. FCG-A23 TaxID=3080561 RepID=UPI002953684E|nr:SAM-dependent methyltransferase [Terasakiella sp. A23]MDV7338052.1 SAM-dependent methyltransferase [Terasakiella sp. A23]